jgi:hypothetical protein
MANIELEDLRKNNDLPSKINIYPSTSDGGIKVDHNTPVFGWKDLLGQIIPREGGGAAPAFTAFRGTKIKNYAFNSGDLIDLITFHMPHDYVPNTSVYIHFHWGITVQRLAGHLRVIFTLHIVKVIHRQERYSMKS